MAGASILRELGENDRHELHRLMYQDARTDLEIAEWAEKHLKKSLGENRKQKEAVVYRYRKSSHYERWRKRYESQSAEMRKALELQKQRLDVISRSLEDATDEPFADLSRHLQGRVLALAAAASDEELIAGMEVKSGWVANALKLVRETLDNRYRQQVEELKAEIRRMAEGPAKGKVDSAAVVKRVDELMGLA